MANSRTIIDSWASATPLIMGDESRNIELILQKNTTNTSAVYHTLWWSKSESNDWHLITYEEGIKWYSSDPTRGTYTFVMPETDIFNFNDYAYLPQIKFRLVTYSSNTYSGASIIGEPYILSNEIFTVKYNDRMRPQIILEITDLTNCNTIYKNTFYDNGNASESSRGLISYKVSCYGSHYYLTQDKTWTINGTTGPTTPESSGGDEVYNFSYTLANKQADGTTVITCNVKDNKGIPNSLTRTITWKSSIPTDTYSELKEKESDTLIYDWSEGRPAPTSLYLSPDWSGTQYTTREIPQDWKSFTVQGDDSSGLINQRKILNDKKNALTLQLYRKYYKYIQEGTWLDDKYIDDNLYYLDANKILNQSSYPKATYTIDVIDIEGIKKYAAYTFNIGQRTYVEDTDMFGYTYNTIAGAEVKTPFKKEVIISERARNLDDPSKSTIKVQTYKNQWEDIFSSLTATTQSLQYASGGYNRAANAINPNGALDVHSLEQTFQQGTFALSGSPTQSITWDAAYGIEITDLNNALVKLRIASNGLAITTDGGTTWNNAITGNGINTNYLLAGQIDASKINILSAAGDYAFSWNENGLNAVLPDYEDSETGTQNGDAYVRFNDLGIYGTTEGSIIEAWEDSHPSADVQTRINYIKQHSNFLLTWDGLTLTSTDIDGNVISLNPNVGLEIFNNDTYTPPSSNPWLWNNTKLGGTTFNRDPQGNLYVAGDKIPVITLGEFYNGVNNQYGLLMRNSNGTPTLYTDENGNLTAISITANDITVDQGFLKRLYLENNSRISYLGSNKEDSQIQDNDVLISIGKTKNGDLYSPGKFIVRADGKYFGELAALNYVAAWDENDEEDYENENTEPSQNAYAILLGEHDNGQSGSSRIGYIFSAFKSNTSTAQATRVFDIRNDGTVDIAGNANISGNTLISGTTTIGGTTTLQDDLTLTGLLKVFKQQSPSSSNYLYLNGNTGQIGNSNGTWSIDITGYAAFSNANVTGTINATAGNFTGQVSVGATGNPQVIIDGTNALIKSSNYSDGAGYGWKIDSNGDAVFNNITARGAIKTAVFEYAEIQAVGGIFLFRPSSTIKEAATQFVSTTDTTVDSTKTYYTRSGNNYTPVQNPSGNPRNKGYYEGNLVLKVEKPLLFAKITYNKVNTPSGNPSFQDWYEKTNYGYAETTDTSVVSGKDYYTKSETDTGSWCKVSNYITDGASADSRVQNILLTNGLNYVYQIINVNTTTSEVTLSGAAEMVTGQNPVTTLEELKGGALVDMGRTDGSTNYGIGVNSSDNTVNLPARAISLFETAINTSANPKVSYNYRGILGTLPQLPTTQVNDNIYNVNMAGTQGIYTDNMYIGDASRFVAFYTEGNQKKLRIKANEIIFEGVNGTDVNASDSMIEVVITSSNGTVFKNHQGSTTLTCTVLQGNNDITSSVNNFAWKKNGENVGTNSRNLTVSDISSTAVYTCDVTLS